MSFGIAPVFILYFWELNNYGNFGWAICLIYSVCCVLRLARFNLTKIENDQEWKNNFFEGIPSPAGGILILIPLIYELSDLKLNFNFRDLSPYLTALIAFLLVSKVPTLSLKKISISSKTSIFLLLAIGMIFISLLFFTFETLLVLSLFYFLSIPVSIFIFKREIKKYSSKISDEDHEDIL